MRINIKILYPASFVIFSVIFFCAAGMAAGKIEVSDKKLELGTIEEGPPVNLQVEITNTGDDPFIITNIRTSCACTICQLPKNTVQPSETITMDVVYVTLRFPGKFDKTIHISTDIPGHKEEVIHLVGHVRPMPMGIISMPSRKIDVEGLESGKRHTQKINLHNEGDAPYTVTRIHSAMGDKVYFKGELTVAPGKTEQVEISFTPEKNGRFMDSLWVVSKDARNVTENGYRIIMIGEVP